MYRSALKRPRFDDDGPEVVVRGQPWYTDGSVVIQVENMQFRLHQTILSESSLTMKEIIDTQSQQSSILVEGCPVIHLPESIEGMNMLILACYNRRRFLDNIPLPLCVVAVMLDLGEKYKVSYLREEGASRIRKEFPDEFVAWSNHIQWSYIEGPCSQPDYKAWLVDCANLARKHGLYSALPSLLYQTLNEISLKEILQGVTRSDGSRTALIQINQHACVLGLEAAREAQQKYTFAFLSNKLSPSEDCTNMILCQTLKDELLFKYWAPPPRLDALAEWDSSWDNQLCEKCLETAQDMHTRGLDLFWSHLPSFFGLRAWNDIGRN